MTRPGEREYKPSESYQVKENGHYLWIYKKKKTKKWNKRLIPFLEMNMYD